MALSDYLAERRREIEAEIKALKAELAEIRIAEEALLGAPSKAGASVIARGPLAVREGSIKDWILKALTLGPIGMETDDVISTVRTIGGPEIPRSSMTPQLSRLKAVGVVELEGRLWRLAEAAASQGLKKETPDGGNPSGVSDGDDPYGDIA